MAVMDCPVTTRGISETLQINRREALLRALDAYRLYGQRAIATYIEPRLRLFRELPLSEQRLLNSSDITYCKTLNAIKSAVESNAKIASEIVRANVALLGQELKMSHSPESWYGTATESDIETARASIRAMFRDWSQEGASERDAAHTPILRALEHEFSGEAGKSGVNVLVPGVGLGRLAHSISSLGYSIEGNDVSYHTLLARVFLFTFADHRKPFEMFPWALSFSNHISRAHQLRKINIPDLRPNATLQLESGQKGVDKVKKFVFTTGSFVELYGTPHSANVFSAIATCYFVDTASNFLTYADTAWNCLKPGGLWINIGPLLWNTEENGPAGNGEGDGDEQEAWKARKTPDADHSTPSYFELTVEEVRLVLQKKGFEVESWNENVGPSGYVADPSSMLKYTYNMAFWTVRKPRGK